MVAPRAGAWVEIVQRRGAERLPVSRPVRARGLKFDGGHLKMKEEVAPRAGAWVEILVGQGGDAPALSRPVRARGLKLAHDLSKVILELQSRPVRARGLK